MRSMLAIVSIAAATIAGCSAATPPPVVAAPAPAAVAPRVEPAVAEPITSTRLPDACDDAGSKVCTPPASFVNRLCGSPYPDVALAMFAKGTPWTRAYLRGNVEAWNAAGGRTASATLSFDEEVLILARREPRTTGIQTGASGSYDVLRWDGTCASLMSDEVTLKHPPATPKHAAIRWRSLDAKVRDALLAEQRIEKVDSERRRECKTSLAGDPNPRCAKADTRLGLLIVEHVRNGGLLPLPDRLP